MNFPIDYDDYKELRKTYPLLLTKIESNTNGEELKKNPVGDNMKRKNTALEKNQAFHGNGLHRFAEKSLPQQFKTPSLQQRSVLNRHVTRGM